MAHLSELTTGDRLFLVLWRLQHLLGRHTWTVAASVQMDEAGIITEVTTRIECVICGEPQETVLETR